MMGEQDQGLARVMLLDGLLIHTPHQIASVP